MVTMKGVLRLLPVLLVTACGSATKTVAFQRPPLTGASRPPTVDAQFRGQAPIAAHAAVFIPPTVQEAKLSNGVRVLVAEKHDFPIVSIFVHSTHGADSVPSGVGETWQRMVWRGTNELESHNVYQHFAAHAAEYDALSGHDVTDVRLRFLSSELPRVVEILGDVLQNASFPEKELADAKSSLVGALASRRQNRDSLMWDEGLRAIYPKGHPYRRDVPDSSDVDAVTRDMLVQFHHAVFAADRTTIIVVGDVKLATLQPRLQKAFGWIPTLPPDSPVVPERPAPASGAKVVYVDRPGDAQAVVSLWSVGVVPTDPDFLPVATAMRELRVRLEKELRTESGFTYGVETSNGSLCLGAPPLVLDAAIDRNHLREAVQKIVANLELLSGTPLSESELRKARDAEIDGLGAGFDTTFHIAANITLIPTYRLAVDEYAAWPKRIAAVTAEDVQRVAKKYLAADEVRIVVVGDEKIARAQIDPVLAPAPATP